MTGSTINAQPRPRRMIDVSALPHTVFGSGKSILWWGTIGMVMIEGTFFALLIAAYFYLRTRVNDWPPSQIPPTLTIGTVNLALAVLTLIPNFLLNKVATKLDLKSVRILLTLMSLAAVVGLILRWFEFPSLNCMWYDNAYGSVTWMLLAMHTVHLVTDAFDTWILNILMFTGPIQGKRFMDVAENSDYWNFVVVTWIPIYLVLYWAPRWL
jgi:heme/copper-type cytochrome/quinol oxidase subunit 3